jgi:hypothetical protein
VGALALATGVRGPAPPAPDGVQEAADMTRRERALLIDVAIACLIAVLLVVVSPGLAVVALVALATLIVVSLSLGFGFLRARWLARRRPYGSVSAAPPKADRSRPRSRPGR